MQTCQLSPKLVSRPMVTERSFVAAVTGEACERLLEMAVVYGEARTHRLVIRMGTGEPQPTITHPRGLALWEQVQSLIGEIRNAQGDNKTNTWLMRMACTARDEQCPRALWHYLRIAAGNLSSLTDSHATIGGRRTLSGLCRTKQAEHKEHKLAHVVIRRYFPDLARVLRELKP